MGEYAKYNGHDIKIGTCEQMYYLRADQVHLIQPILESSLNPHSVKDAGAIRFRFPFPQEDGIEPGAFNDYDYGLGLYGVEPPEEIEHSTLQFTRNYPQSGGILLSIPCPRSTEGKASKLKIHYNGYDGPVHIHSQRLVGGQLKLVMRCGDCGALWRLDTLEDCAQVLAVLENYAKGAKDSDHRAEYYREVARRIVAGYTQPNYWTNDLKANQITA